METAALAAVTAPNAAAATRIASGTPPSRMTMSTQASTSSAAQPRPATRAMPRRISPYHPATAAPISSAATISPRGNSVIAE